MSKIRVPLFQQPRNYRDIDPDATVGATIGTNLYNADGSLFDPSTLNTGSSTTVINGVAYTHVKDPTAARAITVADDKKIIEFTNAGAIAVTMSGLIPFSQGFDFIVFCSGVGGQVTVSGTNGMTVSSSDTLKTRTRFSPAGVMVDDTNEATMYGDIEPVAPALSALVRAVNSSGVPIWLQFSADGQVIVRRSGALVTGTLAGAEVSNTPSGSIAGTTVQAAINELEAEKAPLVHTHVSTSITDFAEAVDDRVATLAVAGTNMTITYNDVSNTLTFNASGGSTPLDTTLTYNLDGTLDVVTTASGTKTMGYTLGKLTSIVGTGIYPSKNFTYTGDDLTGIDVL